MADRQSDSSYDGNNEDAQVVIMMDAKSHSQLSSSGLNAQKRRGKNKNKTEGAGTEGGGNSGTNKSEGQEQSQRK